MPIIEKLANDKVISRSEAMQAGLVSYFTGEPCRRGHTSRRYVSTGNCISCLKANTEQRVKTSAAARRLRHTGGYLLVFEATGMTSPDMVKAAVDFMEASGFKLTRNLAFPNTPRISLAPAPPPGLPAGLMAVARDGSAQKVYPDLSELERMSPAEMKAYCEANGLEIPK